MIHFIRVRVDQHTPEYLLEVDASNRLQAIQMIHRLYPDYEVR